MIIYPKKRGNNKPKKNSKNYKNIQVSSMEQFLEPPAKKKKSLFSTGNIKNIIKDSFGESVVSDWLRKHAIKFIREKKFRDLKNPATDCQLRFDFFLPDHKMCIEFDGKQHFVASKKFDGNDKLALAKRQFKDQVKDRFCEYRGFKMLRISYKQIQDIEKILHRNILHNH